MTLFTPLIKKVTYKRIPIYINTSFRTVLQCFEILGDSLFSDAEKIDFCLELLVKFKPVLHLLSFTGKMKLFDTVFTEFIDIGNKKKSGKKYVDFKQDASFIYSSFCQCYGLDLLGKDKNLHWWSFITLFNGLSDDTKIMQIISIRARPMPKPTKYNAEERAQLAKLKQEYKLKLSPKEEKEQYQQGLAKIAATLQGMIRK